MSGRRYRALSVVPSPRRWLPYALALHGSVVVRSFWGLTRWHALGRAADWALSNALDVTVGRWKP